MKIDRDTPYASVSAALEYLTEESDKALMTKAAEVYGTLEEMNVEQFSDLIANHLDRFLGEGWEDNPTALQVWWVKYMKGAVERYIKTLENLSIPETAEEKRAADGLPSVSIIEGLLVFAQSFFGLRSFRAASHTTLGDIIIAKKAEYRRGMMQRKLDAIQAEKFKPRKK